MSETVAEVRAEYAERYCMDRMPGTKPHLLCFQKPGHDGEHFTHVWMPALHRLPGAFDRVKVTW